MCSEQVRLYIWLYENASGRCYETRIIPCKSWSTKEDFRGYAHTAGLACAQVFVEIRDSGKEDALFACHMVPWAHLQHLFCNCCRSCKAQRGGLFSGVRVLVQAAQETSSSQQPKVAEMTHCSCPKILALKLSFSSEEYP